MQDPRGVHARQRSRDRQRELDRQLDRQRRTAEQLLERHTARVLEHQRDRGPVALEAQRERCGPALAALLDVQREVLQHRVLVLQALQQPPAGGLLERQPREDRLAVVTTNAAEQHGFAFLVENLREVVPREMYRADFGHAGPIAKGRLHPNMRRRPRDASIAFGVRRDARRNPHSRPPRSQTRMSRRRSHT